MARQNRPREPTANANDRWSGRCRPLCDRIVVRQDRRVTGSSNSNQILPCGRFHENVNVAMHGSSLNRKSPLRVLLLSGRHYFCFRNRVRRARQRHSSRFGAAPGCLIILRTKPQTRLLVIMVRTGLETRALVQIQNQEKHLGPTRQGRQYGQRFATDGRFVARDHKFVIRFSGRCTPARDDRTSSPTGFRVAGRQEGLQCHLLDWDPRLCSVPPKKMLQPFHEHGQRATGRRVTKRKPWTSRRNLS